MASVFVHYLPIEHVAISKDDKLLIVITKSSIFGFDFQKFAHLNYLRLLGTNGGVVSLNPDESFENFLLFRRVHIFSAENPDMQVTDIHMGFGPWHEAILYVATSASLCMVHVPFHCSSFLIVCPVT